MRTVAAAAMDEAVRAPFPQHPEQFDADDRISFSKLSNKFILEAEDGQEYEFDDSLKRWVAVVRPHSPAPIEDSLHAVGVMYLVRERACSNDLPWVGADLTVG